MKSIYRIYYSGDAFGDNLFSAYLTSTLINNGYLAYLDNSRINDLVNCPKFDSKKFEGLEVKSFDCVRKNKTGLQTNTNFNVFSDLVFEFRKKFNIKKTIQLYLNHIPVRFKKLVEIPIYDVVIVSETGYWTPYRNWPYFQELKELFDKNCISYIDVSIEKIRNNLLLNYVDNSKLYLGLETGASHYVSKVSNGKTLILQSGYTNFNYWAEMYDYSYLNVDLDCAPCWKREGCSHHKCMNTLKAINVFEEVKRRI
jgi:hypothetical protein